MQKQGKFNLAISVNNFLSLTQSTSTPNHSRPHLFMQETPFRYSIDQFIRNKPYEVVGVKELRPFRNRLRKLDKASTKWIGFGKSSRRISEVGSEGKEELLSKGEVFQCLSHAIKSQVITDACKFQQTNSMNSIVLRGENKLQTGPNEVAIYRNPSISRIKARMKTFEAQWTKKAHRILASPAHLKDKQDKLLKDKEKKDREEVSGQRKSELWRQTLRNSITLADLAKKKKKVVVIRDEESMRAKGHSKFKSQTQWLDLKCQQGYRFKLSCQPTKRML